MPKGKWLHQDPRTCKWLDFDAAANAATEAAFQQQNSVVDVTVCLCIFGPLCTTHPCTVQRLHTSYSNNPSFPKQIAGARYKVEFSKRRMSNASTHGSRAIKREEVVSGNPYELNSHSNHRMNMKEMEVFFEKHRKASDNEEPCIQGEGLMSLVDVC